MTRCDCGNSKPANAEACTRCEFLDGGSRSHARIIDLLRRNDGMTEREMNEALGLGRSGVRRILLRMEDQGRICKQWRDAEPVESTGTYRNGQSGPKWIVPSGHWVYFLTARRAA